MTTKGNDRASATGATAGDSDEVAAQTDGDEDGYQYPEIVVRDGSEGKGVVGNGPQTTTGSSDSAGLVICQVIDDKLQRAMVFKSGLETRSLAVISTAGTLVTLLFALTAVVLKDNDRGQLSIAERATLVAGTLFLLLAALGGILANAPMRAGAVDPRSIRTLLEPEHWGARRDYALKEIARSQLAVWIDIDRLNRKRARILRVAITAEALGAAAIAIAAAQILIWLPADSAELTGRAAPARGASINSTYEGGLRLSVVRWGKQSVFVGLFCGQGCVERQRCVTG